jgi:tRNA-Thr(GGU) m(6)t(6)A37 methyltransferase TsaA
MSEQQGEERDAGLTFIGHVETPYRTLADCPYNVNPGGPECRIVVLPQYAAGLTGLEPGNRVLVLYWLERANRGKSLVGERRSGKVAGAFAARTPHRPNPIGAAMVVVESIDGPALVVRGLDCVNGTPLLDIKPAMRAEAPPGGTGGA